MYLNENRYVKYVRLCRYTVLELRLYSFLFFVLFFTTLSTFVGWFINNQVENIWKRLWPTCLGLRKPTEITDQNIRCGSRFSTYVCRKVTFTNFMRFVAGSGVLQDCFGSGTSLGDTNRWGECLSKGNGQSPYLMVEFEICFECS